MKSRSKEKNFTSERYCGNCFHHNVYEYPTVVLCSNRLVKGLNPKVSTLWCCEEWMPSAQECFCVEEAKRTTPSNFSSNESFTDN